MIRVLDLFSGIGGISLGLERAGGFTTVAFCEIEPFCRKVLAKHWPGVPIAEDVTTLRLASLRGRIDMVAGGFPCQDVSVAGKGAGVEKGERSGLWREMFRIIDELRPRWVLAENVPALRTRGADRVLGDLEGIGYACWPLVVGARHVGAPHRRDRVWVVAHSSRDGQREQPTQERADRERTWETGRSMRWPARPGERQHEWEEPRLLEREVGASTHGIPERLVRRWNRNALKAAGNSVVPQVVEMIGRAIMKTNNELEKTS